MIQSFREPATEDLFHGRRSKRVSKFPADIIKTALRKLDMLNTAHQLKDLKMPPGNRLEALKGKLAGYQSIRVNDQWRVLFRWKEGGPTDVTLTDYH